MECNASSFYAAKKIIQLVYNQQSDFFEIEKRKRQADKMLPLFFNIILETVVRAAQIQTADKNLIKKN